MRTITLIGLILTLSGSSQTFKQKLNFYAKTSGLFMASGILGGIEEGSLQPWNTDNFFKRFPNANRQFWDARISHFNKWELVRPFTSQELYGAGQDVIKRDSEGNRVEKFWLSSSALAWTTDGYHLIRTGKRLTLYSGAVYSSYLNKKAPYDQKWWMYLVDAAVHSLVWSSSFHLTYNTMTR